MAVKSEAAKYEAAYKGLNAHNLPEAELIKKLNVCAPAVQATHRHTRYALSLCVRDADSRCCYYYRCSLLTRHTLVRVLSFSLSLPPHLPHGVSRSRTLSTA